MEKTALRKLLKQQRSSLTLAQVKESSALAATQVLSSPLYQQADCLLGYLAFGKELSVDLVLQEALKAGKRVCVPYIISATEMLAAEIHSMEDFTLDRYGIRTVKEPVQIVEPRQLDLILVPGVAFSYTGQRMGMGAGFYDRYLPQAEHAVTLGMAYEQLMQQQLTVDEFDYPVAYIVNEKSIFQTGLDRSAK